MAAEKQHYVPQFILRQFLCNQAKEQVAVYDKHEDTSFVTSIKNIMAERRFNDFAIDDGLLSFEPIAGLIESKVAPHYQRIVETRQLDRTDGERAALAVLVAFQFVRTKAHRELRKDFAEQAKKTVEAMGASMEQVEGWQPLTEDRLKEHHLIGIYDSLTEFAGLIGAKDFLLSSSARDRAFYLGDNPVCLHNSNDFGAYGNLGVAVPGIEIYLPLSADLMLCAWCPSILNGIRKNLADVKPQRAEALRRVIRREISGDTMREFMKELGASEARLQARLDAFEEGTAPVSSLENMDFYNSLQMVFAHRYVICPQADFELARRHNKEFPNLRKGKKPKFD